MGMYGKEHSKGNVKKMRGVALFLWGDAWKTSLSQIGSQIFGRCPEEQDPCNMR